jgi:flagellar basal-body rod modification protein FlgD
LSVSAVESTPGIFGPSAATGSTSSTTASADKDMFLQLLVAQMRYQDPSNPTDSSQFLAQTAQFTALEKMQAVADQTAQLVSLQVAFGASSLVGKDVAYPAADGTTTHGVVDSVRFTSTGPVLQVGGQDLALGDVLAMGNGSTDLTQLPLEPSTPATPGTTTL